MNANYTLHTENSSFNKHTNKLHVKYERVYNLRLPKNPLT